MTQSRTLTHLLHQFLRQHRIRQGQRKHLGRALHELSPSAADSNVPPRVQHGWRQCSSISPEAFVLFSAALALDTLRRVKKEAITQAIEMVNSWNTQLKASNLLMALVGEYQQRIDRCLQQYSLFPALSTQINHQIDHPHPTISPPSITIEEIFEELRANPSFTHALPSTLEEMPWESLDSMSRSTDALWRASTCAVPVLVSADDCWGGGVPDFHEVFEAVWKHKNPRVFQRGDQVHRSSVAAVFSQLVVPNPHNPATIIGADVGNLGRAFSACSGLAKHVQTYLETRMVFNVTPTHAVVDLHIDYGMDGLSATMHQCSKIWLMFPPTDHNLAVLKRELGQSMRLARFAEALEGGVAVKTDSSQAIFIPAGCLHACFTTSGGFLVSIDCTTRVSVRPFSRYLQYGLYQELDLEGQRDIFYKFLDALEVAVSNGKSNVAIEAWIRAEDQLRSFSKREPVWRVRATQILVHIEPLERCLCENSGGGTWSDHWASQHTVFLSDIDERTVPASRTGVRRYRVTL